MKIVIKITANIPAVPHEKVSLFPWLFSHVAVR